MTDTLPTGEQSATDGSGPASSIEVRRRGQRSRNELDWFSLIATPVAFLAVGIAVIALVLNGARSTGTPSPAPVGDSVARQPTVVTVTLTDYAITITPASVPQGAVSWQVRNAAATKHDLRIDGLFTTEKLDKNQVQSIETAAMEAGTYTVYCDVPGHKDLGMQTTFVVIAASTSGGTAVEAGPAAAAAGGAATPQDTTIDYRAVDAEHERVVKEFLSGPPAATKGIGNTPLAPTLENGVKVFDLEARVVQWEVAPGAVYEAWTYNGTVPGPEIRMKQGETVKVRLKNSLPESTSIHFHGLEVADNKQDGVTFVTQDPIKPGETYVYTLTPLNCGSHMYHSHHAADAQVPLGLLGSFVVECTTTPVPASAAHDKEYTEVLTDGPLGFGINGKGFPATQPIVAKVGERTMLRFMNEGLMIHPMHLHGHTMTVVAKDGNFLAQPMVVDTLNIAPGERYDVIVTNKYPGAWAFHCHILTHAESEHGLHGMTTVWVVQP